MRDDAARLLLKIVRRQKMIGLGDERLEEMPRAPGDATQELAVRGFEPRRVASKRPSERPRDRRGVPGNSSGETVGSTAPVSGEPNRLRA